MKFKIAGIIAATLLSAGIPAQAQLDPTREKPYPTREIRVVVGLPAGSGGDVVARYYADKLSQLAGKPVIVENKPGGGMVVGSASVAKAAPDGYTMLLGTSTPLAISVTVHKALPNRTRSIRMSFDARYQKLSGKRCGHSTLIPVRVP